jgi:hypothetical protein
MSGGETEQRRCWLHRRGMSFASSLSRGKDKDGQHDTRGCREAGGSRRPTASAPGGRQWPSHHSVTARVLVHTGRDTLLLYAVWLTSGPGSILYFQSPKF